MNHNNPSSTVFNKTKMETLVRHLIIALCLGTLWGCHTPAQSLSSKPGSVELASLVREANGSELMVVAKALPEKASIEMAKELPLPAVLEATGQVTFDDKLVSTIISRLTGRIEEIRSSQWEVVRSGELVMKVYSPDYMSAEAEYLAAISAASPNAKNGETAAFGIPAFSGVAESLKEAAVRKLDLLGFSPSDIAAIRTASPSVWVRAPISGIIVSKNVVRGQTVNPGDQLFALATLERVWITADIYQDDLTRVWVGQELEAVTSSYPEEVFKGTVQRISPALDPNIHTLQLRCQVSNPKLLLKPQMLARVRLQTKVRLALVIPESALVFDDQAYYVFIVVDGGKVERRQVEIADWEEPGYTRIVGGIKPGERFYTTDTLHLNALWHTAHSKAS